jgi:hypothetical protein
MHALGGYIHRGRCLAILLSRKLAEILQVDLVTYVGRHDVENAVRMLELFNSIFCCCRAHNVGAHRFVSRFILCKQKVQYPLSLPVVPEEEEKLLFE